MKVHLPFLLCLLFPFYSLTAQHHIGFSVGPTLTYGTVGSDNSETPPCKSEIFFQTPLGVQASLQYGYSLSESFRVSFGLQYDHRRYELQSDGLRWGSQHDGQGRFDPCLPGDPRITNGYYTSQFIGIPLMVRYDFGGIRLRPFVSAGLNPSAHVSQAVHIADPFILSLLSELSPEKTFHLYGRAAGGLAINVGPNLSVLGQLVVDRDLTAIGPSALNERLYGFSLQLGIERAL